MRRILILLAWASAMLIAGSARADSTSVWDGGIRMGGIVKDEVGDQSVMQETFNVYEGYSVTSLYLKGRFNPKTHLRFNLNDINLDDRNGTLDFRRTGMLHFRSRYDESRFVFDPAGAVDAMRRDFWSTLSLTPAKWIWLSADYGLQTREGDRIGYPSGVQSALGTTYDFDLNRYRIEAQMRASNGIGGTIAADVANLTDHVSALNEREGRVYSANLHVPGLFFDRLTHVVRASIGRNELKESGLGYDMETIQYTGVLALWPALRAKYRFYGGQVDDEATNLRTNRYIHDGDIEVRYRIATLSGGYGWEAWDDDRSVTTYDNLRAALALRADKVSARFSWSTRSKEDEEDQTLLRDTEYDRWDARIETKPVTGITVGGRLAERNREMPDIGSQADGFYASAYGRYDHEFSGDAGLDAAHVEVSYQYSDDDYVNTVGGYHVKSDFVTGRVHADVFDRLTAGAGVTVVSITDDLDIVKSILSFDLGCALPRGFSVDAKYNVYNYDDYLVAARYYTANVVWLNVGYDFSTE